MYCVDPESERKQSEGSEASGGEGGVMCTVCPVLQNLTLNVRLKKIKFDMMSTMGSYALCPQDSKENKTICLGVV